MNSINSTNSTNSINSIRFKLGGIGCIILAAGEGTRFKSEVPKVLYELYGKTILQYVLNAVRAAGIGRPIVVVGHKASEVKNFLKGKARAVVQKRRLGTADAVKVAKDALSSVEDVLVLYGDNPLIKSESIRSLIKAHKLSGVSCTLLVTKLDDPTGYGRILRDPSNRIVGIVEDKEASPEQRRIREINAGAYCFKKGDLFDAIEKIKKSKVKKEYYLTDLIAVFADEAKRINAIQADDPNEAIGINSRGDLAKAHSILKERTISKLLNEGVTILSPQTTFIAPDVKIGKDTIIYPFVVIEKDVKIGKGCSIGPFCRIRRDTVLEDNVELGNFVEVVRSRIKSGTKAKHLTYLGDASIGKDVNVGCGTITANYDGKGKYRTTIGDGAFIGSGTVFVAPVKIGKGALTGAGCVVLRRRDVPAKSVVVGVPGKILKKVKK